MSSRFKGVARHLSTLNASLYAFMSLHLTTTLNLQTIRAFPASCGVWGSSELDRVERSQGKWEAASLAFGSPAMLSAFHGTLACSPRLLPVGLCIYITLGGGGDPGEANNVREQKSRKAFLSL